MEEKIFSVNVKLNVPVEVIEGATQEELQQLSWRIGICGSPTEIRNLLDNYNYHCTGRDIVVSYGDITIIQAKEALPA